MQSEVELDGQIKIMIAKSKENKPYGFALIPECSDGNPAMFFGKTEMIARNAAKEELKTAKKKVLVLGLIYTKDKNVCICKGSKPIKPAIIKKAFKKLKSKTKRYKWMFSKSPTVDESNTKEAELEEKETTEALSGASASNKKSKGLKYLERVQSMYDDLVEEYKATHAALKSVLAMDVTTNFEGIEQELLAERSEIKKIKKEIRSVEKFILSNEDTAAQKAKVKELLANVKTRYATLELINNKLKRTQGINESEDDSIEIGSADWLLKQAEKIKETIDGANLSSSSLPREIQSIIQNIKGKLGNDPENPGSITQKEQDIFEASLRDIIKRLADAKMAEAISADTNIMTKARTIWQQAYAQSLSEAMRFHAAVLAHAAIGEDMRYSAIQKSVTTLRPSDTLQNTLMLISTNNEERARNQLDKAIKKYVKDEASRLSQWKALDKSTIFGSFSVYAPISKALKQLKKL